MIEYIIFAVGVLVMFMVCGGLFYATAYEMSSHTYHKTDERKRNTDGEKTKT